MTNNHSRRLNLISGLFLLAGLLLVSRLFQVQIVSGEKYRTKAEKQYNERANRSFDRGRISFKSKDGTLISAAALETVYSLIINPSLIKNREETLLALKQILPELDEAKFREKTASTTDPHEELLPRLEEAEAKAIKKLNLPGLNIKEDRYRVYPGKELAAHVIGLIGYQGEKLAGRYGLEREYEELLQRGESRTFNGFLSEIFSRTTLEQSSDEKSNQTGDLVTTIEPNVQQFLEKELEKIELKWQSRLVGGIVLDPRTGAVLAMAARPSFNPGEKRTDLSVLNNPLIEKNYEMGSIMKPLTIASGLDAGVVSEKTEYDDLGTLTIDGRVIGNYDGRARGRVPLQEVLNQSLNTGAVFVMRALGRERFRDYFTAFGLGQKTGIDLPAEAEGLINNLSTGRDLEYANISYGQGIAMTPINITVALSTLANGGYIVKPHVVDSLHYQSGLIKTIPTTRVRQVIKEETAKRITDMLVKVVDEALDHGRAKLARYRIAAKTGTAQIPKSDGTGYETDKFLHSFFGYFPASAPRFSVFLFTVEPVGVDYASQTLTEPFSNLAKFLLNYYQVPPDR